MKGRATFSKPDCWRVFREPHVSLDRWIEASLLQPYKYCSTRFEIENAKNTQQFLSSFSFTP